MSCAEGKEACRTECAAFDVHDDGGKLDFSTHWQRQGLICRTKCVNPFACNKMFVVFKFSTKSDNGHLQLWLARRSKGFVFFILCQQGICFRSAHFIPCSAVFSLGCFIPAKIKWMANPKLLQRPFSKPPSKKGRTFHFSHTKKHKNLIWNRSPSLQLFQSDSNTLVHFLTHILFFRMQICWCYNFIWS